jgi:hypothetical protein
MRTHLNYKQFSPNYSWELAIVRARYINRIDGGGCCGTLATRWRSKLRSRAALATSTTHVFVPRAALVFHFAVLTYPTAAAKKPAATYHPSRCRQLGCQPKRRVPLARSRATLKPPAKNWLPRSRCDARWYVRVTELIDCSMIGVILRAAIRRPQTIGNCGLGASPDRATAPGPR